MAGLLVVLDLAVLEVRHEQIADDVLVADGKAQRTCRTVSASDRRRAVRVAWEIPGLPDLAQGDIGGRAGLRVPARLFPVASVGCASAESQLRLGASPPHVNRGVKSFILIVKSLLCFDNQGIIAPNARVR